MPKINFASSMIVEDHLKKVITMTKGTAWKFSDNKMLPVSQHSVFGDFPKTHMKGMNETKAFAAVPTIDQA